MESSLKSVLHNAHGHTTYYILILMVVLSAVAGYSQTLTLDNSFNPTDVGSQAFGPNRFRSTSAGAVKTLLPLADGKFLIGGEFPAYNGVPSAGVARINFDGTIDDTFNHSGISGSAGFISPMVNCLLEQPDGKILIAGHFTTFNGATRAGIARLTSNGALDNTFDPGNGIGNATEILAIASQSDGKIIIAGTFTNYDGTTVGRICRLNEDGSLDTSFLNPAVGNTGADNNAVKSIVVLPDDKILIGGSFTSFNGVPVNRMLRLHSNGSIDVNWNNIGTGASSDVNSITILSDGNILVAGSFSTYAGQPRSRIARLSSTGILDATFAPPIINGSILTVSVQSDGNILIGGSFTQMGNERKRVARLNGTDGTLDLTFDPGEGAFDGGVYSIFSIPNGPIVVGGTFTSFAGVPKSLVALTSVGELDSDFNAGGGGANGAIGKIAELSDGSLFISGYYNDVSQVAFSGFNNVGTLGVAKLTVEGALDASFISGFTSGQSIYSIIPLSEEKVLISGVFNSYGGLPCSQNIIRLNGDGTRDGSFNAGTGANGVIQVLAVQDDNKVLIGGTFTTYNGLSANRLARINEDGSLDATFNFVSGINGTIYDILPLEDGRTLVVGTFNEGNLMMLQADGLKDPSFIGTDLNSAVRSAAKLSDGKFLIVGHFGKGVARVHADGTLDETFNNSGSGANQAVTGLKVQADGKIVIWGTFSSYNGVARSRMARLNLDGSLDEAYDVGSGTNGPVNSILLQGSKYIVAGDFSSFNGVGKNRIARINLPQDQDISFNLGINSAKTYGDASFSVNATGGDSGNVVVFSSSNTDVATISNGNTVTILSAGETEITATQDGAPGFFAATPVVQTLTVSKVPLIATAENKSKIYGDANPTFTITYTGFKGNDDASMIDAPPVATTTAVNNSNIGDYDITLTGGTDTNYSFGTYEKGTLTINKATLSATADDKTRMYGDANPALTITYTGLKGNDNASMIDTPPVALTTAVNSSNVGDYNITLSGGTDNNYIIGSLTNGTLSVEKATLTVTAVDKTRKYGEANPLLNFIYSGFKNSETESTSGITAPAISTTASISDVVGNYPITLSGGNGGANYVLQLVAGQLTIEKADQTITFLALGNQTMGSNAFTLSAVSSAGLPVSFVSDNSNKISLAGNQATLVGAGRVVITALQAGNANYNAAPLVDRSLCINPAQPLISVSFANPDAPVLTSSSATGNSWYRNEVVIAGASAASYTVGEEGSYKARIQVDDCVSDFSNEQVIVVTDLPLVEQPGAEIVLYPNPVTDYLLVAANIEAANLEIVNNFGAAMKYSHNRVGDLLHLNVQLLPSGVYFLRVHNARGVQNIRFVKQ